MCSSKRRPAGRAVVLLAAGLLGACAPADRATLTREVVAKDPEFAAVLEKRKEQLSRIQTFERELALKRSETDKRITQLRTELAAARDTVRGKIAEAKTRMEPDRKRVELALALADEQLRAMTQQRDSVARSMVEIKKSLRGSQEVLPPEERAGQERRLGEMTRDAERLAQEIAGLKEHIRLLKVKLLLIRI